MNRRSKLEGARGAASRSAGGGGAKDRRDRGLRTAASLCELRGSNLTPLRRHVLGLLLMAPGPAKAYHILPKVKESGRAVPATLYRALDFLLEARLVHRIVSLDAYVACSQPARCVDPLFLICEGCGRAEELPAGPGLAELVDATAAVGFAPRETLIEIAGHCRLCAEV